MKIADVTHVVRAVEIIVIDFGEQVVTGNIDVFHRIEEIGKLILVGKQTQRQFLCINERLDIRKYQFFRY